MSTKMKVVSLVGALGLLPAGVFAQTVSKDRLAQASAYFKQVRESYGKSYQTLPPSLRRQVDFANRWDTLAAQMSRGAEALALPGVRARATSLPSLLAPVPLPAGKVNDPKRDLLYSSFLGMFQSNSSTAWCSPNAVTVFNNTEDLGRYFTTSTLPVSFVSYSYSTNNAASFFFGGPMTQAGGPIVVNADATVACTDKLNFLIATTSSNGLTFFGSTDGGKTFSTGTSVAPPANHSYNAPWIAADPSDATKKTLYVAFEDFDQTLCAGAGETTLASSKSTDGGGTWSAPLDMFGALCGQPQVAPTIAIGTAGVINGGYWTFVPGISADGTVRSTDGGASWAFTGFRAVTSYPGDPLFSGPGAFGFQGNLYPIGGRPQVAVDRSGKVGFDNNVYVVFERPGAIFETDNGSGLIPDSVYGYSDIYLDKSTDGGATYLGAVRLNSNIEPIATGPYTGRGTDQYQPGIAVDKNGAVGVCWYDRRNDPANFLIDRYCAKSVNQNLAIPTFSSLKKSVKASPALPFVDVFLQFVYGDFDNVASDFTKATTGFRGAYTDASAGQPDVKMAPF